MTANEPMIVPLAARRQKGAESGTVLVGQMDFCFESSVSRFFQDINLARESLIYMQIKLFTIPVSDNGAAVEEMNRFLRGNKILEVESELISNQNGSYWCFCVRYIEKTGTEDIIKEKIDYKKVLDEATFSRFSKLREIRKKVAAEEGLPAYAVFTDEELAGLAKLETITRKGMLSIKGIGDKKVERFGSHFVTGTEKDEKTGLAD